MTPTPPFIRIIVMFRTVLESCKCPEYDHAPIIVPDHHFDHPERFGPPIPLHSRRKYVTIKQAKPSGYESDLFDGARSLTDSMFANTNLIKQIVKR